MVGMGLVDSTVGAGEHGQKTPERFLVGSDTEHVTEAVLRSTCGTYGWWGGIPGRGCTWSKSLEV